MGCEVSAEVSQSKSRAPPPVSVAPISTQTDPLVEEEASPEKKKQTDETLPAKEEAGASPSPKKGDASPIKVDPIKRMVTVDVTSQSGSPSQVAIFDSQDQKSDATGVKVSPESEVSTSNCPPPPAGSRARKVGISPPPYTVSIVCPPENPTPPQQSLNLAATFPRAKCQGTSECTASEGQETFQRDCSSSPNTLAPSIEQQLASDLQAVDTMSTVALRSSLKELLSVTYQHRADLMNGGSKGAVHTPWALPPAIPVSSRRKSSVAPIVDNAGNTFVRGGHAAQRAVHPGVFLGTVSAQASPSCPGSLSVPHSLGAGSDMPHSPPARDLTGVYRRDSGCSVTSANNYVPVQATMSVNIEEGSDGSETINQFVVLEDICPGKVKLVYDQDVGEFRVMKMLRRPRNLHLPARSSPSTLSRNESASSDLSRPETPTIPQHSPHSAAFLQEIAIMKKLRHKNIVTLYEVIDDIESNVLYLVMQYVEHGPLVAESEKTRFVPVTPSKSITSGAANPGFSVTEIKCDIVSPFELIHYARQIAAGLGYLHLHRIVHNDIKPANILKGRDDQVFLADFGVAEFLQDDQDQPGPVKDDLRPPLSPLSPLDKCETESPTSGSDTAYGSLSPGGKKKKRHTKVNDKVAGYRRMAVGTPVFFAPEVLDRDLLDQYGAVMKQRRLEQRRTRDETSPRTYVLRGGKMSSRLGKGKQEPPKRGLDKVPFKSSEQQLQDLLVDDDSSDDDFFFESRESLASTEPSAAVNTAAEEEAEENSEFGYIEAGQAGDIWALGVSFFMMLTGYLPFQPSVDELAARHEANLAAGDISHDAGGGQGLYWELYKENIQGGKIRYPPEPVTVESLTTTSSSTSTRSGQTTASSSVTPTTQAPPVPKPWKELIESMLSRYPWDRPDIHVVRQRLKALDRHLIKLSALGQGSPFLTPAGGPVIAQGKWRWGGNQGVAHNQSSPTTQTLSHRSSIFSNHGRISSSVQQPLACPWAAPNSAQQAPSRLAGFEDALSRSQQTSSHRSSIFSSYGRLPSSHVQQPLVPNWSAPNSAQQSPSRLAALEEPLSRSQLSTKDGSPSADALNSTIISLTSPKDDASVALLSGESPHNKRGSNSQSYSPVRVSPSVLFDDADAVNAVTSVGPRSISPSSPASGRHVLGCRPFPSVPSSPPPVIPSRAALPSPSLHGLNPVTLSPMSTTALIGLPGLASSMSDDPASYIMGPPRSSPSTTGSMGSLPRQGSSSSTKTSGDREPQQQRQEWHAVTPNQEQE